jgi:uncharacterized protein YjiS (DUF1127 family)
MPSSSHRTSLGQATPHRAESGSTALPTGFTGAIIRIIGAPVRWCADRLEDWRELRQLRDLDDHLLRDIGLTVAEAQRSAIFHVRRDRDAPDRNALDRNAQRADRDAQDPKGMPSWPTIF